MAKKRIVVPSVSAPMPIIVDEGNVAGSGDWLQAGVDDLVRLRKPWTAVRIPAGVYRLTDTLVIDAGAEQGFGGLMLEGERNCFNAQIGELGLTYIVADFTDRPLVAIKRGRGVILKNLAFIHAGTSIKAASD